MSSQYVDEFMKLKCSSDVLSVVNPLGNKASKEITESMGIIKKLRKIVIKDPMKYTLYDLCAGNALTSVIASFLLPVKESIAIDVKWRKRRWHLAKRFTYLEYDIYDLASSFIEENSIIIAVHPCGNLARRFYSQHFNIPNHDQQ